MLQDILSTAAANIPIISNYFGAQADRNAANHAARENYAQQKEFAQNGIQWKIEDARKAGLHPLAALGASTASTGGTYQVGGGSAGGDLGRSLASMGQNVSRAVAATATADQREMSRLQLANARLDLEGKQIDNQIRSTQLQKLSSPSIGPAFPSANDPHLMPGQGNSMPGVQVMPSKSVASERGRPGIQAGMINSLQYVREADGKIGIAPSEQAKERIEDDVIAETMWHFRNRLNPPAPRVSDYPLPPEAVKKGYDAWVWNPGKQNFEPGMSRIFNWMNWNR